MSGKSVKLYELCAADTNRRFSPYCWRTRFACWHKGLKVEGIPMRFTEKDKIKYAKSEQVPVLDDGKKAVNESYEIAKYLEESYPEGPSLFGGPGGEQAIFFTNAYADALMMDYFPLIMLDIWHKLDGEDKKYFRSSREETMGNKSLESLAEDKEKKIETFQHSLEPVRTLLEAQPYIGGQSPNYADYTVAGTIMTPKCMTKLKIFKEDDPVEAWFDRILQKFSSEIEALGFLYEN